MNLRYIEVIKWMRLGDRFNKGERKMSRIILRFLVNITG